MTTLLHKGHVRARATTAPADISAAQALRMQCFGCDDRDALDAVCTHILIEDAASGALLCCYRMLALTGREVAQSYSAQFYDLSALEDFDGPMVELGRFCIDPAQSGNPDVLRAAWGAMTAFVDARGVALLFGCSSYAGTDASLYRASFAMLGARHIAPKRWLPQIKAPKTHSFATCDPQMRTVPDLKAALRATPPLLRTYLAMGGWVSDHAVVDEQMNTLHVFTGVEIASIPEARKRLLRAVAG